MLYMDEIAGFFPPVANPPSKRPLLTLLKQGRAFGLGVVLATQNPGRPRLQGAVEHRHLVPRAGCRPNATRRACSTGWRARHQAGLDRAEADRLLSALGKRVFLLHNVHEHAPRVFQTRWTMSYLRGPLSRDQIRTLMADRQERRCRPVRRRGRSRPRRRRSCLARRRSDRRAAGASAGYPAGVPAARNPGAIAGLFSRGARGRADRVHGYHAWRRVLARCRVQRARDRCGSARGLVRSRGHRRAGREPSERAGTRRFVPAASRRSRAGQELPVVAEGVRAVARAEGTRGVAPAS